MRPLFINTLLCLLLAGCATTELPPLTSVQAPKNFALEEDEKRSWNRSEEEQKRLNKSGLILNDKALEVYLNEVARRIQPEETYVPIPFKVVVIRNHLLNAFAYPNGVIYVHTGLLARMDNEAQLATVLAHEMTHATHRHVVRGLRNMKNKTAVLATLGALAGPIGSVGTLASVTGYSRELETEADMEGLKLVIRAGYDPAEAPKLFLHLKQEVEEEKTKEPFVFGMHPKLQDRYDNYDSFLKEGGQKGGIKNSEIFLQKTREMMLENASLDLKAGRFAVARRGAEKYAAMAPNDPRVYQLLGEILRQRGEKDDPSKAIEHYKKAISLDASYPEPHKGMGLVYFKQQEKALAKKHLKQYLQLAPGAKDRGFILDYLKGLP